MAGSNMEVFRFGFYLFFPIFMMYKFGDPVWYEAYVQPYRDRFIPSSEASKKPPQTTAALQEELAKYRARRQAQLSPSSLTSPSAQTTSTPLSDVSGEGSTTLETLVNAEMARRKPVVGGMMGDQEAVSGKHAGDGSWGWGQSSSNSGRLV